MIFISSDFINLIDQQIQCCLHWSILTHAHLMSRQHIVLFNHFLNLLNSDCLYNLFNNVEQNYWFSKTWTDIKVFFYFAQNYCSSSAKMLEIINQLSTCLYKNHNDFCEKFSHYLEKSIKNFIYIRNTELFLLVHDIQNVILDYL